MSDVGPGLRATAIEEPLLVTLKIFQCSIQLQFYFLSLCNVKQLKQW